MTPVVLQIVELSKRYRLGARRERHVTAREAMSSAFSRGFAHLRGRSPGRTAGEIMWALKDVSFDVHRGEVVGVIGRNGAGKSTLLKILSRITEPTSGYADVVGRVSSLLEVGTGFHMELTGRENIFLNGAILGMTRHEVQRKFDDIVEFAEVARFIDTPVKHFSTGMHLRLAFSVAAHLEPDVLLVDEVLAVGDAEFQKKCLGKMEDVASTGRTVLFVSHNLGVVRELCHSCAVLNGGELVFRGSVSDGLARYSDVLRQAPVEVATGSRWHSVRVNGDPISAVASMGSGDGIALDGHLTVGEDVTGGSLICLIEDSVGNTIVHERVIAPDGWEREAGPVHVRVRTEFPALWLSPGAYTAYFKFLGKRSSGGLDRVASDRVLLDVLGSRAGISRAILAPACKWAVQQDSMREPQAIGARS